MEQIYKIPALAPDTVHRVEENIRRSRFIASIYHANSKELAKIYINQVRSDMPSATHHCSAFVAGPAGHTALVGYSDDGEPHGTAGRPMLTVLLHSGIGEIVVVVTRYFGGIKLGTGGLVRAYQQSVQKALDSVPTSLRIETIRLNITLQYNHVNAFLRILENVEGHIITENFGAEVQYQISIPKAQCQTLTSALRDITGGDIQLRVTHL